VCIDNEHELNRILLSIILLLIMKHALVFRWHGVVGLAAAACLAVVVAGCNSCSGSKDAEITQQITAEKGVLQSERDRTDSLYRSALKQVDEMMTVLSAL